jgi:hypothetical protein
MLDKNVLTRVLILIADCGFLSLATSIVVFAMSVILEIAYYARPELTYPTWFYNVWVFTAVVAIVCIVVGCVGYFVCVQFKK